MRSRILAAVMAVLALAIIAAPAAQAGHGRSLDRKANALRAKVVKRFGARAAGRDIIRLGVVTKHGTKPAPTALKRRYVATLDRTLNPPPVVVVPTTTPTIAPTSAGSSAAPSAPSSGGYCGAYQFDQQTWTSVGGSGSPCGASPAEQDRRAAILRQQRGTAPWPVCGRGGASMAQIRQCENGGSYR